MSPLYEKNESLIIRASHDAAIQARLIWDMAPPSRLISAPTTQELYGLAYVESAAWWDDRDDLYDLEGDHGLALGPWQIRELYAGDARLAWAKCTMKIKDETLRSKLIMPDRWSRSYPSHASCVIWYWWNYGGWKGCQEIAAMHHFGCNRVDEATDENPKWMTYRMRYDEGKGRFRE